MAASSSSRGARASALVDPARAGDDDGHVGLVVLVVDVADHGLHQVLHGRQAVGAAELVDDQGHVGALGLHAQQQVSRAHGARHIERVAAAASAGSGSSRPRAAGPRRGQQLEDVLDVDDADGIVAASPLIDRHPADARPRPTSVDHLGEGRGELHRHDVHARRHHVARPRMVWKAAACSTSPLDAARARLRRYRRLAPVPASGLRRNARTPRLCLAGSGGLEDPSVELVMAISSVLSRRGSGTPQCGQDDALKAFHLFGLGVGLVVVSYKMQHPVRHQ